LRAALRKTRFPCRSPFHAHESKAGSPQPFGQGALRGELHLELATEVAKARIEAALALTATVEALDVAVTSPRIPSEQP
jgi:hypothetical protein